LDIQKNICRMFSKIRSAPEIKAWGANQKPSRTLIARTILRLVLLSDTHQLHREVDVPDGDILIHAGDFTMFSESMEAVADFNDWLGELPHRSKAIVEIESIGRVAFVAIRLTE
jgi:hypothetical protein